MPMNNLLSPFSQIRETIHFRRSKLFRKRENMRLLGSILQTLGILALFLIFFFLFFRVRIAKGVGMYPSILDGDLVLCYRKAEYVKNDVIFFQVEEKEYMGRVVAIGGDVLDFSEEGVLTVNGTVQAGEIVFPTYPPKDWEGQFEVPADSVFVLGDYRTQTEDSRDFGCIALEDIEGKAITVLRHRKI